MLSDFCVSCGYFIRALVSSKIPPWPRHRAVLATGFEVTKRTTQRRWLQPCPTTKTGTQRLTTKMDM